jgi:hypothetical protein
MKMNKPDVNHYVDNGDLLGESSKNCFPNHFKIEIDTGLVDFYLF